MRRYGRIKSGVLWAIFLGVIVIATGATFWLRESPEAIDEARKTQRHAADETVANPVMPPSATRPIESVPTH